MPAITFDRFDGGLDLRQLHSSADANRLRVLKNAYVTTGKTIKRRPGLQLVGTLPENMHGIFSGIDGLFTFTSDKNAPETIEFDGGLIRVVKTVHEQDEISAIEHVEIFNGYIYVAVTFKVSGTKHFYATENNKIASLIEDEKCPHSKSFIKKAGKVFAIDGSVVRFSATNNPRDWSSEKNAGFLPVALQQSVNNFPTALGEYQDNLVVFFEDTAQIWQVDADPANHRLIATVPVGTRYPYCHANMSNDIFFLSPSGFRSIAVQAFSTNMMDNDIGSPIDKLVNHKKIPFHATPKMIYFRGGGQIICWYYGTVYVYCFSRSSKISAWCTWEFPQAIVDFIELDSKLYVLTDTNRICELKEDAYRDYLIDNEIGYLINVEVELPFLDMRMPGILKQFTGFDLAASGEMEISFKYDPRNPELETIPMAVSDDTRILPRLPVEVMATNMSVNLKTDLKSDFELAAITLYFERMSGFSV